MPQLGEGLHLIPLNWKVHQHIIPILREIVIQHNNSQHGFNSNKKLLWPFIGLRKLFTAFAAY